MKARCRIPLGVVVALCASACASNNDGRAARVSDAANDGLDDASFDISPDSTADVADAPVLLNDEQLAALLRYEPVDTPHVVENFEVAAASDFWQAPWPADLRATNGVADLRSFPNPDNNNFVARLVSIAEDGAPGFGVSSAIYLPLSQAIAPALLPTVAESRSPGASVVLLNVDRRSDEFLRAQPIDVQFTAEAGRYGGTNILASIPYQGAPLRESTRYALVATTALTSASGEGFSQSGIVARLSAVAAEQIGDDRIRALREAVDAVAESGIAPSMIAGITVFTTGAPTAALYAAYDAEREAPLLHAVSPATVSEQYDTFCVVERTAQIRNWQHGAPPFEGIGGDWQLASDGTLREAGRAPVRIWFTVPQGEAPEDGWPVVLFARTGGGGDRPLIDRGVRAEPGGAAPAGSGLANTFAAAGYVGVMIDGPHGGERNPTRGDEQFLMFNIANPIAMRDNVRESALELAILADQLALAANGATNCDGESALVLNPQQVALFGHSMGATIAPLVAAASEPVDALLLSGAGGSWTNNILFKQLPIPTRPVAEFMLSYRSGTLNVTDPVLNLLQWVGEPADPQVYAQHVALSPRDTYVPRDVLMMQGIADTYILPPIANALSLPLGVALLGESLESLEPESAAFDSVLEAAAAVGHDVGPLQTSATANIDAGTSALLVQYREDGIEDGHEVVFQLEAPKRAICSFLRILAGGEAPSIEAGLEDCN